MKAHLPSNATPRLDTPRRNELLTDASADGLDGITHLTALINVPPIALMIFIHADRPSNIRFYVGAPAEGLAHTPPSLLDKALKFTRDVPPPHLENWSRQTEVHHEHPPC